MTRAEAPRLALSPLHLVRLGAGVDAVRLQARGTGVVLGSLGLWRVRGGLDALVFRRLRSDRCRVLFLGLHGVAWASLRLPAAGRVSVPAVGELRGPTPPAPRPAPELAVQLTVTPPEPP